MRSGKKSSSNYDAQVDIGKRIFLEYDQNKLIQKFGLRADEEWIYLTYLNTPCRISRQDGRIDECFDAVWEECRSYNTVMTIYDLLCYHKGPAAPVLFGSWCPIGHFVVTGIQETESFTQKYALLFQDRVEKLQAACLQLGGSLKRSIAGADITCEIPVTNFFPVLLQFWEGDDEFSPKLMLMWDRNTDSFLHFETTFYLQGDLLERLRRQMYPQK
ncbi:MAG: DUF3786 domain-containing protein [Lachnospiraceae bacterium]|nr:DUF3786 domain-containing protein [Lachnospiraceae bacterium]